MEDYLVRRKKWLTEAENNELIAGVERELETERESAVNSPMPTPESALGGVYCDETCHTIKPKYAMPKARSGKSGGPKQSESAVHLR
jgi:TPP-dependent pyruvate/acetoin dehydrogenase alpha subunit